MLWKEIRSWAKTHGYECKKLDSGYSWNIIGNTDIKSAKSVSKLAKSIFNHMTDNKFVDHQASFDPDHS